MLIGLVGKPSAGKSSFFSAATMVNAEIASYPFTTIEPNKGIGFVRVECVDREFNVQCSPRTGMCVNGTRHVPVEIMDVAGLVPGAHRGKGRGNAFLDDLRQADVLVHVVDASGSANEKGEEVGGGNHDPCLDVRFLEEEIDQWFFGVLKKNWVKMSKAPAEGKSKTIALMQESLSGLGVGGKHLESGMAKAGLGEKKLKEWSEEEMLSFAREIRKESKPIVIAANKCDLEGAEKNIARMKEEFPEKTIVACSAASELSLKKAAKEGFLEYLPGDGEFRIAKELSEKQEKGLEVIKKNVLEKFGSTGVQETLEESVFRLLGMIAVFPGGVNRLADSEGNILPDCFLMPKNSSALDFAFRLHSDIGEGFIKAIDVRKKVPVGKDHELRHRDVIEIVFRKK